MLLRAFRWVLVAGAVLWVAEFGDLSLRARAFVDTALAGWTQPAER